MTKPRRYKLSVRAPDWHKKLSPETLQTFDEDSNIYLNYDPDGMLYLGGLTANLVRVVLKELEGKNLEKRDD